MVVQVPGVSGEGGLPSSAAAGLVPSDGKGAILAGDGDRSRGDGTVGGTEEFRAPSWCVCSCPCECVCISRNVAVSGQFAYEGCVLNVICHVFLFLLLPP